MKKSYLLLLGASSVLSFTSCKKDNEDVQVVNTTNKKEVILNYSNVVYNTYKSTYELALEMKAKINHFVNEPISANLESAQNAWLAAREPYGQSEAFRFYSGPIDNEESGTEGLLNAWPLDENFIDYTYNSVTDKITNVGIIADTVNYPILTKTLLESLNEDPTEKSISVGYHAIEFLLWGQDLTAPADKKAGQRSFEDFIDGKSEFASRRRTYLTLSSELLVQHIKDVKDAWEDGSTTNYRASFGNSENDALQKIFTGIAELAKGELAGERILVAYNNKDQEDEHSCFSDNTHRDIYLNFKGIKNVYYGEFNSEKGASLADLVKDNNTSLASELDELFVKVEAEINAMAIPFDFAITDATERTKVILIVNSLQDLGDKLAEAGDALGLTINI